MSNEFEKPAELINPNQYLGKDLRELSKVEFDKLFNQYSKYKRQGFTDELLGEQLGQNIFGLRVRREQAARGNQSGIDALQNGSWVFTDEMT